MAFLSTREQAAIERHVASQDQRIAKLTEKKKMEPLLETGLMIGEGMGGAAITGFLRGTFEKQGKVFAIGPVDGELLLGGGLVLLSLWKKGGFGKLSEHVRNTGVGILCHYAGQMGRQVGKGVPVTSSIVGMLPDYVGSRVGEFAPFVGKSSLASALEGAAA